MTRTEEMIKVLKQDYCEDAVSRDEVNDIINHSIHDDDDWKEARRLLRNLPSVIPSACIAKINYDDNKIKDLVDEVASNYQTEVARWIKETSVYGWDGHSYQCSKCGRSIHLDTELEDLSDYPYCHCGCKMEDEDEGNN